MYKLHACACTHKYLNKKLQYSGKLFWCSGLAVWFGIAIHVHTYAQKKFNLIKLQIDKFILSYCSEITFIVPYTSQSAISYIVIIPAHVISDVHVPVLFLLRVGLLFLLSLRA